MNLARRIVSYLLSDSGAICAERARNPFGRRIFFAAATLVAAVLAVYSISHAKFSDNVMSLLPVEDKVIREHREVLEKFGQTRSVYFSVSASTPGICASAADSLAFELSKIRGMKNVLCNVVDKDADWSDALLPMPSLFDAESERLLSLKLSPPELERRFDSFRRSLGGLGSSAYKRIFAADPVGVLEIFAEKLRGVNSPYGGRNALNDFKLSTMGSRKILLIAEGNFSSSDSCASKDFIEKIDAAVAVVKSGFPNVEIDRAGAYVISSDNSEIAGKESSLCLSVTALLMFALCMLVFRRRLFALIALIPSALGTLFAFGVISFACEFLSAISIAFAAIAMGVSIDYAVHVLYRLDSLDCISARDAEKTASTLQFPILIAAGTTLVAFFLMCLSGSSGFIQLGIFGILGIGISAFLSICALPAFVVGFPLKRRGGRLFDRLGVFFLSIPNKLGAWVYAVALLAALLALPFVQHVHFEGDMSTLSSLKNENSAQSENIRRDWGAEVHGTLNVAVFADSFDEAACLNENLLEVLCECGDLEVSSAASIFPSKGRSGENIRRWKNFWSAERIEVLHADIENLSRKYGFKSGVFDGFFEFISGDAYLSPEESPLMRNILYGRVRTDSDSCSFLTRISPLGDFDAEEFSDFLSKKAPYASLISPKYLSEHTSKLARDWSLKYGFAALALIALYLFVAMRNLRRTSAILVSVLLGLLWGFGALGAFGVPINVVNSVFVVFAVCMAQDYAVFLIAGGDEKSSASAVLVSAFTTCAAFGTLAFASHPVLGTLGKAAVFSILGIMFASFLLARKIAGGDNAR